MTDVTRSIMMSGKIHVNLSKMFTVYHTAVDPAFFNHPQTVFRSQLSHSHGRSVLKSVDRIDR